LGSIISAAVQLSLNWRGPQVAGPVEAIPTCTNVVGVAGSELRTRAMGPVSRLVFSCRLFSEGEVCNPSASVVTVILLR